ncbi:MAG TPA: methyltransferase, partial [Candidatus Nanoarchaeia archaeon]|nr:methyltransferase [Candidatus Nanoarchaeia archaeon]
MKIVISKDLKKQEVWANGAELANVLGMDREKGKRIISYPEEKRKLVHIFKNPVLMTDNYRISKLQPSLRDTLFSLFSSKNRIVEYDKVSTIDNGQYKSVWSPSIDTVLFAKALKKIFEKRKDFDKVAEIGTGSGFLSKYCLVKNNKIKSLLVNDLNPYAIESAMKNISDKRANYYVGDGIE